MVKFLVLVFVGLIIYMFVKGGPKGNGVTAVGHVAEDGSYFVESLLGG